MIYYGGEEFHKSFKQAEQEKEEYRNIYITKTNPDVDNRFIAHITQQLGKVVAMLM